ncbi:rhombosortase [Alkalilimnicola sp. S0819]|nr:rhombosortase [Alkalilimnicola sp. S0819]MPQ16575.1 rhombosortase [Alkalilimnicola sp. S0819]
MWFNADHPAIAAWPLWLLGALALVVALAGNAATGLLRYEREQVLAGEWWRLLSGQLVHLGPVHLLLNLAGLGLLAWLFAPALRAAQWWGLLAGSWLGIALGFVLLEPQLAWYVGLSGVLHGLLAGGALMGSGLPTGLRPVLLLGILLKLGWEQWAGGAPATAGLVGGPIIVNAHLYGACGGLLAGVGATLPALLRRYSPPPP